MTIKAQVHTIYILKEINYDILLYSSLQVIGPIPAYDYIGEEKATYYSFEDQ